MAKGPALMTCKACGRPVAKEARACPSCGNPPPRASLERRFVWALILLALVVGWVAWSIHKADEKARRDCATTYTC